MAKQADERVRVPNAADMSQALLRLHCDKRHGNLTYFGRHAHALDHQLRGDKLEHTHKKAEGIMLGLSSVPRTETERKLLG